jgi:hypothetical protein
LKYLENSFDTGLFGRSLWPISSASSNSFFVNHKRPFRLKRLRRVQAAMGIETSRVRVDRLLDPENASATRATQMRAARVVARADPAGMNRPGCNCAR